MRIVYRATYMREVVAFALQTLKDKSPVGTAPNDRHPGLYRDNHLVFLNGHVVADVSAWKAGDQIHISNPVPYSRKIESGKMKLSVPNHVYETTAQIVASRYGNQALIKFVFMPVRFGDNQAWADFTKLQKTGRKLNDKARRDWLVRQPALQITAR